MKSHVVVKSRPYSDGDATQVPSGETYTQVNPPNLYLEKTGQAWMQARGEARPGVKYILEHLPSGYTMWERPRPSNLAVTDKYLFGHPSGKKFDSPNRFFPHFQHLMDNAGDSFGCPCTVCAGSSGILPGSQSRSSNSSKQSTPKAKPSYSSQARVAEPLPSNSTTPLALGGHPSMKGRPPKMGSAGTDTTHIDEEGTPDVYRNLIDKLRRFGTINETIEEPLSPDWVAEQSILPKLLQRLRHQDQWIPRSGDVVLYVRELPNGVDFARHEVTGEFQLYNEDEETILGHPLWEAGLVGEVPTGRTTVDDLYQSEGDESVIYSGVRVEPLPDPNGNDKSLSKRHKYVPLCQVRPFVLWKDMLYNVPKEKWHATIVHALTISSTLSLGGKFRFRGTWPQADIYCHELFLGGELVAVGDTVRLLPNTRVGQTVSLDVLVIKTIRLKWSNMDKSSNNDYDEGRPYNSEVWVYGSAYTSDASRSSKEWLTHENITPPKSTDGYGDFYPLHPLNKELAVPFSRLLGRLYELEAMKIWMCCEGDDTVDLDIGRTGILEARQFSRQHDRRITREPGATWYWGDSRADALNLHSINGLDVTKYDQERDIRDLRKNIKIIRGMQVNNQQSSTNKSVIGKLDAQSLRRFMAPGTMAIPDRTQLQSSPCSSSAGESSSSCGSMLGRVKKRPHILDLSDDDNDEEIRASTRVVDEAPGAEKKKVKVMVVID